MWSLVGLHFFSTMPFGFMNSYNFRGYFSTLEVKIPRFRTLFPATNYHSKFPINFYIILTDYKLIKLGLYFNIFISMYSDSIK